MRGGPRTWAPVSYSTPRVASPRIGAGLPSHQRIRQMASNDRKPKKTSLHHLSREFITSATFQGFMDEMQGTSDRACAVIAGAAIDTRLIEIIRLNVIVMGETATANLFHERGALLGTLSAKSEFCHILGLINDRELSEIDIIRRIRNAFSHSATSIDFSNELVIKECQKLQLKYENQNIIETIENDNRRKFVSSVLYLYVDLFEKMMDFTDRRNKSSKEVLDILQPAMSKIQFQAEFAERRMIEIEEILEEKQKDVEKLTRTVLALRAERDKLEPSRRKSLGRFFRGNRNLD